MADCKHQNTKNSEDADSGAHIVYCSDCGAITHACFKPLYDEIEKQMEEVRTWGVNFAKGHSAMSAQAAASRRVETVLGNLRLAMLMARITKNEIVEALAKQFEAQHEPSVAAAIRDFKLEVAIHEFPKK